MRLYYPLAVACVLAILTASAAPAATVSLDMVSSNGSWQLYADSSLGDNAGIASFNIPLLNIATLTNEAPWYQANSNDFQPAGFSALRNPATDGDPVGKTLGASQQII